MLEGIEAEIKLNSLFGIRVEPKKRRDARKLFEAATRSTNGTISQWPISVDPKNRIRPERLNLLRRGVQLPKRPHSFVRPRPLRRRSQSDTWEWDGSFWTQMNDIGPTPRRHTAASGPRLRSAHVAAFDRPGIARCSSAEPGPFRIRRHTWAFNGTE